MACLSPCQHFLSLRCSVCSYVSWSCLWLVRIIIIMHFTRTTCSMVISSQKFWYGLTKTGTSILLGHPSGTVCLSRHKSLSCFVVLCSSSVLLPVTYSLLMILCTCTMGSVIWSSKGTCLDKEFTRWLLQHLCSSLLSRMVWFSTVSISVLVWFIVGSLQTHFLRVSNQLQTEIICHTRSDWIFQSPKW